MQGNFKTHAQQIKSTQSAEITHYNICGSLIHINRTQPAWNTPNVSQRHKISYNQWRTTQPKKMTWINTIQVMAYGTNINHRPASLSFSCSSWIKHTQVKWWLMEPISIIDMHHSPSLVHLESTHTSQVMAYGTNINHRPASLSFSCSSWINTH